MKSNRSFGVEIELNTVDSYRGGYLEQRLNAAIISPVDEYGRRSYDIEKQIRFDLLPGWKAVYDGTCGSELVSPPLTTSVPIQKQLIKVKESGLNYSMEGCGLHVHVSAVDFENEDVAKVARFCRYFDRTIFSFMKRNRINGEYCKLMARDNATINREVAESRADRYRGCNIAAMMKHGTIEFRYAEGTDSYQRISALVDFYTAIMDWVKNNPIRLSCKPNIRIKREYLLDLLDILPSTKANLMAVDSSKEK